MTNTYKNLGKVVTTDTTTEKVLYTSGTNVNAIINGIVVNNTDAGSSHSYTINVYNATHVDSDFVATNDATAVWFGNSTLNVYTGTDGLNWTTASVNTNGFSFTNSTYKTKKLNNTYFIYGGNTVATASKSGNNVTILSKVTGLGYPSGGNIQYDVVYQRYLWWNNYNANMWTSTDAVTWTANSIVVYGTPSYNAYVSGNSVLQYVPSTGLYFANEGAGALMRSSDGITWTSNSQVYASALNINNGVLWLYNGNGTTQTTVDGVNFTTISSSSTIQEYAFGNNTYLGVYTAVYPQKVAHSTDAVSWTIDSSQNIYTYYQPPFFANGNFYKSDAYYWKTSTDAITWTALSAFNGIAYISISGVPGFSSTSNYLYRNHTIGNDYTDILRPGITLGSNNTITVIGDTGLSFSVNGVEL
jgi:hypothetical protein